jgi:hypothetical protein
MRTSPAPASRTTVAMKKFMAAGTPSWNVPGLVTLCIPLIRMLTPIPTGTRVAAQSNLLVFCFLPRAVNHAVVTR